MGTVGLYDGHDQSRFSASQQPMTGTLTVPPQSQEAEAEPEPESQPELQTQSPAKNPPVHVDGSLAPLEPASSPLNIHCCPFLSLEIH